MNYRALEDLIGILVKKAGYKLSDLKVEEDIDFLEDRKRYLEGEISTLKNKLDSFSYVNKDDKLRDEEEKKYLEETLQSLNNSLSELDTKINDKSTKVSTRRKLEGDKVLLVDEVTKVNELLELVNLKLQNKAYFDGSMKSKDEVSLKVLESELEEVNVSLEEKYKNPVILGNKLLEAYKDNQSFDQIKEMFDNLIIRARNEYDKTNKEIKDTNIFELMDRYTSKKRDKAEKLEANNYSSEDIKQDLFEKEKYHNSRIDNFKNTLDGIDKRKEELRVLIDESKKLYESVHKERELKEDRLSSLVDTLYNEFNLIIEEDDYKKAINELKNEIVDDKFLENKYNTDIQSFKDEMKNLDINFSNIQNEVINEEKSLEIIHEKLSNKSTDLLNKFEDKVNFLVYSNRVEKLANEQQYLYVNVEVIKDEVMSLWTRGAVSADNEEESSSYQEPVQSVEEDPIIDEVIEEIETPSLEEETSMYEETSVESNSEPVEVIDYLE